jgi:carboxyl-terminal processing protease
LTTFGQHSAAEMRAALDVAGTCPFNGVILDLRDNAGGLLEAAVETCDLLIDSGRIVSTRGRDRRDRSVYDATPSMVIPRTVPVAVLINKYSASASEIVAACLQDHQRAVVIGERSWGKGTVQNLLEIEGGRSALKLTTASYWRPSGKNIHRRKDAPESDEWGVSPSPGFEVKLSEEAQEKLRLARRDRDLGRERKGTPKKSDQVDGGQEDRSKEDRSKEDTVHSPPVSPEQTGDDPQLRKAIDYLKENMK